MLRPTCARRNSSPACWAGCSKQDAPVAWNGGACPSTTMNFRRQCGRRFEACCESTTIPVRWTPCMRRHVGTPRIRISNSQPIPRANNVKQAPICARSSIGGQHRPIKHSSACDPENTHDPTRNASHSRADDARLVRERARIHIRRDLLYGRGTGARFAPGRGEEVVRAAWMGAVLGVLPRAGLAARNAGDLPLYALRPRRDRPLHDARGPRGRGHPLRGVCHAGHEDRVQVTQTQSPDLPTLRSVAADDEAFLRALYRTTRVDEFASLAWSD